MTNPYQSHEAFSGTYAKAYTDGEWMAQFHSVSAELSLNYDEVPQSGVLNAGRKFTGYEISGSMTGHQYDGEFIKKQTAFMRDPKAAPPVSNLLLVNEDPAAKSPYKVMLYGVKYEGLPLFNGEHGTITEQEVSFTADSFEIIEE